MRGAEGYPQGERSAFVYAARYVDRAAVQLYQLVDEGESDAGAFMRATARMRHTIEALEQTRQSIFRNAGACIGDAQHSMSVVAFHRHANLAVQSVLEGIGEQIEDNFFP